MYINITHSIFCYLSFQVYAHIFKKIFNFAYFQNKNIITHTPNDITNNTKINWRIFLISIIKYVYIYIYFIFLRTLMLE